jgi:GDPmannose 4,6-dehydratase
VKDFAGLAFGHAGLDWQQYVDFDERYLRPAEVDSLVGDSAKVSRITSWVPKVLTPELARIMVDADMRIVQSTGSAWVDEPLFS